MLFFFRTVIWSGPATPSVRASPSCLLILRTTSAKHRLESASLEASSGSIIKRDQLDLSDQMLNRSRISYALFFQLFWSTNGLILQTLNYYILIWILQNPPTSNQNQNLVREQCSKICQFVRFPIFTASLIKHFTQANFYTSWSFRRYQSFRTASSCCPPHSFPSRAQ